MERSRRRKRSRGYKEMETTNVLHRLLDRNRRVGHERESERRGRLKAHNQNNRCDTSVA